MPKPAKSSGKTFEAVLQPSGDKLNWIIIRVPLDVQKVWGTRGQLKVKGEINGFPFRTSLFPDGKGRHIMMVNKKMQRGGAARPGEKARFRIEPDTAERVATVPLELKRVLKQSKPLERYFNSLRYSIRKWITDEISARKQAASRVRRAEQVGVWLMEALEAEHELPPLVRIALSNNAKAQAGWELMTSSHRRQHLLGIFYPRSPESRQRRVQKAVEMMQEYAQKRDVRTEKSSS
jgi:uncharacterized protein YdeI (YjbR/CyaY-like superfamily)